MEKSYFSFVPKTTLGEVSGPDCGIVSAGGKIFSGCNSSILSWNLRTIESVQQFARDAAVPITSIATRKGVLVGGYQDGTI